MSQELAYSQVAELLEDFTYLRGVRQGYSFELNHLEHYWVTSRQHNQRNTLAYKEGRINYREWVHNHRYTACLPYRITHLKHLIAALDGRIQSICEE